MKYQHLLIFALFLNIHHPIFSQKTLSGMVIDSLASEPLPFVNIGIKSKNIGTTTDENGNFSLSIPPEYQQDTLTFSFVGYRESSIRIDHFDQHKRTVKLIEDITQLDDVEINAKRLVERKFGIKKRNLIMHFSDGMFQGDDSFEIGQLIRLKEYKARITSVNLYLFDSERDSVTIRINFYAVEDGLPTKRLSNQKIIQRHPVKEGWLRLDISEENIAIKGNFVVTLEFLPEENEADKKVFYEVKLGGSSRSYYRRNSLGTWSTPPHHYCMYVTALVDKSAPEEPDEIETPPITSIWSEQVKDSFNIFLRLPTGYEKRKHQSYPVIYCLDANAYFDHLCQIVSNLAERKKLKMEPIIVGIGYANVYLMDSIRVRDYTFPAAPVADSLPISGGGEKFYNFLISSIVPYIDHTYATDTTNRTILGHSFGGYFVTYSMWRDLMGKSVFNHYVAASPSLWYSNGYLIKQFDSLHPSGTTSAQAMLFLTIGEEELTFENDNYFETFRASMQNLQSVELESKIYPNLDHMGAAIPSFEDTVEAIFGRTKP